jgi:hypothetical protein
MAVKYNPGDQVFWELERGTVYGEVIEVYTDTIRLALNGTLISRIATREEPAYLVEQDDGKHVLKSQSELNYIESAVI